MLALCQSRQDVSNPLIISMSHCDIDYEDPSLFTFQEPTGRYNLDLEKPYVEGDGSISTLPLPATLHFTSPRWTAPQPHRNRAAPRHAALPNHQPPHPPSSSFRYDSMVAHEILNLANTRRGCNFRNIQYREKDETNFKPITLKR